MTPQPQPPRPDPIGDFQRWLMKSGAKEFGRGVRGNLRKTFGRPSEEDVWSQATREYPDEPPECEWCPICRAARKYRDSSGPGVGGHLTGAGDAFASVVSDAFSAFESALSVVRPPSAPKEPSGSSGSTGSSASSGPARPARPARPVWFAGPTGSDRPPAPAGPAESSAPSGSAGPAGSAGPSEPAGPAAGPSAPAGPQPAEPEPAPAAGSAAAAGESVAAGGAAPAGGPGEEPVIQGPVTAEPDAWDLATGDGQGEPADDLDHRG